MMRERSSPLPEAADREHVHTRDVICRGFRRADGLWDIEGTLVDTKTYGFDSRFRGRVEPGDPVHEMWIRLTLDDAFEIRDLVAVSHKHPFRTCADITPEYRGLVGTRIQPGWTRLVRKRLGDEKGCTHLTRLLQEMAVVAIQTIWPLRTATEGGGDKRPGHIDGCHALRADGPIVAEYYPRWHRSGGD